ncbi:MAG TPA: amidohydrolase family protein [Pyrinomonadaceae bacterium]|nr:amidohydrolase family protein [Pyrinomonadaceae bacterium]
MIMRTHKRRRHFAALFAFMLVLAPAQQLARAQQATPQQTLNTWRNPAIDTYAITNARIVPVSGAEIPRGTVVIRNGLIAAVGANVAAPADARTIDGAGLTVYPGLFDAHTNLGTTAAQQQQQRPAGVTGAVLLAQQAQTAPGFTSPNSTQPAGLQPEILASDIIRPGGDQIEGARSAGITAALTAPREGIFAGQSAVINLAGDTPQGMIVRSPVALHVGFTPLRGGQYPASLLGVFAAVRQMFLDAQRYRQLNELYDKNPRGMRRPEQDKSLAALLPVLSRQMPVVFIADNQRQIERALDLAKEFNLRAVIAGGMEAWKVADRLAAEKVPVLVSLNFPRRTAAPAPDADPEPLRVLRERVEAPRNPGRLAAAGVRFAFQSGGLANMADYLTNASRAVEGGLAREEALRAMTLRPAEFFGVESQLGTIEAGKIANLTVIRGDIFDRNRQIAHVFIDGRPVELRPAAAQVAGAQAGVTGQWTLRVRLRPDVEDTVTLNLRQEGDRLSGGIQGDLGSAQIANARITPAGEISFTVPVTYQTQTNEATFNGRVSGNEMSGTVSVVGSDPGTFAGARAGRPPGGGGGAQAESATPASGPDLSGTWTLSITIENQQIPATLTLRQQGATLTGTIQSPFGTTDVANGSAGPDGFRFTAVVNIEGQSTEVTFTGTATGNSMSGTANSSLGAATFTGTRPGGSSDE